MYITALNEFNVLFLVVILEKSIRIPRSLSVKAASILKGFLNKVLRNFWKQENGHVLNL